jgi:hypothetical protein
VIDVSSFVAGGPDAAAGPLAAAGDDAGPLAVVTLDAGASGAGLLDAGAGEVDAGAGEVDAGAGDAGAVDATAGGDPVPAVELPLELHADITTEAAATTATPRSRDAAGNGMSRQ